MHTCKLEYLGRLGGDDIAAPMLYESTVASIDHLWLQLEVIMENRTSMRK